MTIRAVGSSYAYVIQVDVPTPKTSRGEGWGQYYSNLKWQIWDKIEKNTQTELGIEQKSFEDQQLRNARRRKALDDSIRDSRKAIERLRSGEISAQDSLLNSEANATDRARQAWASATNQERRAQANSEARARSRSLSPSAADRLSGTTRDAYQSTSQAAGGAEQTIEERGQQAVAIARSSHGGTAGGVLSHQGDDFETAVVSEQVEWAKANASSLGLTEDQAAARALAQWPDNYQDSYLNSVDSTRTGMTGRGARDPAAVQGYRPSGRSITDRQPHIDRLNDQIEADQRRLNAIIDPNRPTPNILQRQRQGFANAMGGDNSAVNTERFLDLFIDEEISRLSPNATNTERQLARQRGIQQALATVPPPAPLTPTVVDNTIAPTAQGTEQAVINRPPPIDLTGEPDRSVRHGEALGALEGPIDLTPGDPYRSPLGTGLNPNIVDDTRFVVPEDDSQIGTPEIPINENLQDKLLLEDKGPLNKDGDFEPRSDIIIDAVSATSPPDEYRAAAIVRAAELVSQPKRLNRISKKDLPERDRRTKVAEYVSVVDSLMSGNRRLGDDYIKNSWDEISRTYVEDPKTMSLAHDYLLAIDMLETDSINPTLEETGNE